MNGRKKIAVAGATGRLRRELEAQQWGAPSARPIETSVSSWRAVSASRKCVCSASANVCSNRGEGRAAGVGQAAVLVGGGALEPAAGDEVVGETGNAAGADDDLIGQVANGGAAGVQAREPRQQLEAAEAGAVRAVEGTVDRSHHTALDVEQPEQRLGPGLESRRHRTSLSGSTHRPSRGPPQEFVYACMYACARR